jgi:hypothetical protein
MAKPQGILGQWNWVVCGAGIALSFWIPLSSLPKESLCWFYNLTHVPCPGCGLTRAFLCISQGHWSEAWKFNPFGFFWYGMALYGFLRPLLLSRWPSLTDPVESYLHRKNFFPLVVGLMFLVWVWRLGTGNLASF